MNDVLKYNVDQARLRNAWNLNNCSIQFSQRNSLRSEFYFQGAYLIFIFMLEM